jgi:subtilisin family serine protease
MASANPTGATVPDQITVPADVLVRHGVRQLDQITAVRDVDGERPLSTAYRPDTLLVPAGDLKSLVPDNENNDYDKGLAELGLVLRRPKDPGWDEIIRDVHDELGVPAQLVRTGGRGADQPPDAWTALVALRTWFGSRENLKRFGRDRAPQIGLDHLLMAAADTQGAPYTGGGSVPSEQSQSNGIALHTGDRNPVQVLMPAPHRRPVSELPLGRRPVIAVLDTGIGKHHWLPVGDPASDPVVEVSDGFQAWMRGNEEALVQTTGAAIVPLADHQEVRNELQPLLGLTDSHSGHGTFVAGLVFQNCPDARILSLRMLHSDGYSTEGTFLLALEWLRKRAEKAASTGDPDLAVDVVSLSLGFYPETADPAKVPLVAAAIQRLTDLGVLVVAAAGNDATTRMFLPAAYGRSNPLVAAIGALNASGRTVAAFSNAGPWIGRWTPGNALVSTVPVWQGATGPMLAPTEPGFDPVPRTSPDIDDLTTGFAMWAGTSFATPVVAGKIGSVLVENASLARMSPDERAKQVLKETDDKLRDEQWPVVELAFGS